MIKHPERRASVKVGPHEAGLPVVEFLSRRFTYHNRKEWKDLILAEKLLLNQYPTLPATLLAAGDTLEYIIPDGPEPPVDTRLSIIFEDEDLIAVDKPADLPCHPAGRYFRHTLWSLIKTELSLPTVFLVNRIDRETSGVVLLAKSSKSAHYCSRQFESHQVYKRYLALVEGQFPSGKIKARGYLLHDADSPVRKKLRFYPAESSATLPASGKNCTTLFSKTKSRKGISQVEAIPETGRPHQIRATLCCLGYPVVGDKIYGVDDGIFLRFINNSLNDHDRQRLRLSRQALHSAELHIRHPYTKKPLRFKAPLPLDMQNLIG
jgi:RluA family pseudouridine synthase